jgi:23S rRNA pseudouridine1911/1915/1917 synthase
MQDTLTILYEDNHLLVVNKAAGVLVQGDATGDIPLVEICKKYIGRKYQKPGDVFLGVVHRIDRPVSGVVVFARTSKALERMNALFKNRETKKTYWAIVSDKPEKPDGVLIHWLQKDEKRNKTTAFRKETPDGQRSELSYRTVARSGDLYLLEVNPVTGRPHQIRVQLASIGCPITGDLKYGSPAPLDDSSILLHARQLEFIHPVRNEAMKIVAELPNNKFWNAFSKVPGA